MGENVMSHIESKLEHMLWEGLDMDLAQVDAASGVANPHHLTLSWEAFEVL